MKDLKEVKEALEKLKEVTEILSKVTKEEKEVSFEEIRSLLAGKSVDGHKDDVKALINKYGGNKLSDIKPEDYNAFYKEAKEIGN